MSCTHEVVITGAVRGYTGGVAVHPYTHQNPRAHGGIEVRETCDRCGATRRTLTNGRHEEVGPWGPTLAAREAVVRAAEAKLSQIRRDLPGRRTLSRGEESVTVEIDRETAELVVTPAHPRAQQIAAASGLAADALILRAAITALADARAAR